MKAELTKTTAHPPTPTAPQRIEEVQKLNQLFLKGVPLMQCHTSGYLFLLDPPQNSF